METKDFFIERRIREKIGNGRRLYNIIAGFFFMFLGGSHVIGKELSISDSSLILNIFIILISIIMITFGIIGKEPIKTKSRLEICNENLTVKKTFESEIKIKLSSISGLKFLPKRLEVTYGDFIKTYDFNWLSENEYEKLSSWLREYCKMKGVIID